MRKPDTINSRIKKGIQKQHNAMNKIFKKQQECYLQNPSSPPKVKDITKDNNGASMTLLNLISDNNLDSSINSFEGTKQQLASQINRRSIESVGKWLCEILSKNKVVIPKSELWLAHPALKVMLEEILGQDNDEI